MSDMDLLTTEEAALELGVTTSRVRQMIRAGDLPAKRFGKVHLISRDSLKIAEQRKTAPGPAPKPKEEPGAANGKSAGKRGKKGSKR